MKRRLLLGIAIIGASISAASAADLDNAYSSDWSGLYGTLSGGYSGIRLDGVQSNITGTESDQSTTDGALFGAGLGFNHDTGDFVFGLDGDISLLTNDNRLEMKETVDADYDWFATGRVRAGYDLNGTLLYATGGIAALSANFEADGDSHSETFIGWTAGGGVEHMVSESISIKAEALFADFGSENFSLAGDDTDIDADMVVVRAGISFRF